MDLKIEKLMEHLTDLAVFEAKHAEEEHVEHAVPVVFCVGFQVALELAMLDYQLAQNIITAIHDDSRDAQDEWNHNAQMLIHLLRCKNH